MKQKGLKKRKFSAPDIISATPLYEFLRQCNATRLKKIILDCGAGSNADRPPPLFLFYQYGYKTYGIELEKMALANADRFCKKNDIPLNIIRGDMRRIPFKNKYALGSVGFRIIESVFVFVGWLSLLSLLTLGQEFIKVGAADASSFKTIGTLLLAIRHWAHDGIVLIAFCLGALLYYCVFYQSKLIPRWLSGWGLLGAALSLSVTLYSLFNPGFVVSLMHTLFNAPIALQEMVLAVWLIVKGFNPSAIASGSAEERRN